MKQKFLDFSISFLQKYKSYSEKEIKELRYGLEGIYLTVTKFIIIILVACILGILKEVFITIVLFNIIRFTGFGFHAKESYQCLIFSMFAFIFIPFILINVSLSDTIIFCICMFCIFSYILFAPADTVKRPLTNKKKRIIRKISTTLIGILYTLLIFLFPTAIFRPLLLAALIIQAVVIQPGVYMLFKQPYNNYKNYRKAFNT